MLAKQPHLRFDENADAAVSPAAWSAYAEAAALTGDPRAAHAAGRAVAEALRAARRRIAAALHVEPDELVFTSGGTEADALAIAGSLPHGACGHVVTTSVEHAAVTKTLEQLARAGRARVTRVRVPRGGRVRHDDVAAVISADTALVTVIAASNETGVVQPVHEIAAACRARGVRSHVDAVQVPGRAALDVPALGAELVSISGHKLGAVGGVGVLYVRRGCRLAPLLRGDAELASLPGIASLAAALEHLPDAAERARIGARRDRLEAGLRELPDVEILGAGEPRLCNTSAVRFGGCEGDGLMMALDLAGVAVSTGSACSTGSIEPSPILLGMGLSQAEARQTLRFSLSRAVGDADVERVIDVTRDVVRRMRR